MELQAKLGPLPVWAWGAIGGVGIIAFMWWRGRGETATEPNTVEAVPAGEYVPTAGGTDNVNTTTAQTPGVGNDAWITQGVLIASGLGYSEADIRAALTSYLNGNGNNDIAGAVIAVLGLPPSPPRPIAVLPTPKTPKISVPKSSSGSPSRGTTAKPKRVANSAPSKVAQRVATGAGAGTLATKKVASKPKTVKVPEKVKRFLTPAKQIKKLDKPPVTVSAGVPSDLNSYLSNRGL